MSVGAEAYDRQSQSRENDSPPLRRLEIFEQGHEVSWRPVGIATGAARMDCLGHDRGKWVTFTTEEWYEGKRGTVARQTMFTLGERSLRALRDYLNDVLGEAR